MLANYRQGRQEQHGLPEAHSHSLSKEDLKRHVPTYHQNVLVGHYLIITALMGQGKHDH